MKAILSAVIEFFKEIFEEIAPVLDHSFNVRAEVLKHSIVYGPDDGETPRHITTFMLDDLNMIEKYGLQVDIVSEKYYMTTRIRDHVTLRVKENPDYDPDKPGSQKLILAEDPK